MTEQNNPERVFAFWTYDRFPYVLSAAGHQIEPDIMKLDGFGRWGMNSLFTIQSVEMGEDTKAKLQSLEAEYHAEEKALLEKYKAKALKVLPALAMTKPYGGNFL